MRYPKPGEAFIPAPAGTLPPLLDITETVGDTGVNGCHWEAPPHPSRHWSEEVREAVAAELEEVARLTERLQNLPPLSNPTTFAWLIRERAKAIRGASQ